MAKVQVILDRAGFRPGKIDAMGGEFTQKAADRFVSARGPLDTASIGSPYREYVVREDDTAWVGPQAATPPEQEKLKQMVYADLWEFVAERFHCDLGFLKELNPALTRSPAPGDTLRVPDVAEFKLEDVVALEKQRRDDEKARKEAEARRLEQATAPPATPTPSPTPDPSPLRLVLLRGERLVEMYEGGQLIGCFPCTPGSSKIPVPEGTWKITGNILLPYFRWDKSVLETGKRSGTSYNLPPGPNNPVGIVWMAINRPSVGMHGTPWPDQIGRNESAGCIRLANWDAFLVSQRVAKRTPVEVR